MHVSVWLLAAVPVNIVHKLTKPLPHMHTQQRHSLHVMLQGVIQVNRFLDRLIDWLVGWLVGGWVGWLVGLNLCQPLLLHPPGRQWLCLARIQRAI